MCLTMQVYIYIGLLIIFTSVFSSKLHESTNIEELSNPSPVRTRRATENAALVTPLQLKIKKTYYDEETINKIKQLKDLFMMA